MGRKILVQISHPAHVHFYKNFIKESEQRGIKTLVLARDKDIAVDLLQAYDIDHEIVFEHDDTVPVGVSGQIKYEYAVLKRVLRFKPDIITAIGGTAAAHISSITSASSYIFTDSEGADMANKITVPFADRIFTPSGYSEDYGSKHIRYEGYHELAYLHPNCFTVDEMTFDHVDCNPDNRYFVLRFIGWGAQHDVGHHGLSLNEKRKLVSTLDKYGEVFITAESELEFEFEQYRIPVPPELIHDFLAKANLYVGDSQTMATEAAILGTPAIRTNSFAGEGDMSNFIELEEEYNLLHSTPDGKKAISKAEEWARNPDLEKLWVDRRTNLLEDKIDVSEYLTKVLLESEI